MKCGKERWWLSGHHRFTKGVKHPMRMIDTVSIVWSPVAYFRGRYELKPRIISGFGVVILSAVLYYLAYSHLVSVISTSLVTHLQSSPDPGLADVFTLSRPISNLIVLFNSLQLIAAWILGTLYVAAVAVLLNVELPVRKLFEVFGESFLPLILFGVFVLCVALFFTPQGDPSVFASARSQDELVSAAQDYMHEVLSAAPMIVIRNLQFAFWGWVFALWIAGLLGSLKMSAGKAFLAAGSWAMLWVGGNYLVAQYVR
jgi:hypothetical protein